MKHLAPIALATALVATPRAARANRPPKPLTPLYRALARDAQAKRPILAVTFVALCENKIIDCGNRRLGRGDSLRHNLYWGTYGGTPRQLDRFRPWKKLARWRAPKIAPVLAMALHRRSFARGTALYHLSVAYRGIRIERATQDFVRTVADGKLPAALAAWVKKQIPRFDGTVRLVGYVGHNRLLEKPVLTRTIRRRRPASQPVGLWALACYSKQLFAPDIKRLGATPILLARTLMYPGGFLVRALLDGLARGRSRRAIAYAAARAMQRNMGKQGITLRSARRILWPR